MIYWHVFKAHNELLCLLSYAYACSLKDNCHCSYGLNSKHQAVQQDLKEKQKQHKESKYLKLMAFSACKDAR